MAHLDALLAALLRYPDAVDVFRDLPGKVSLKVSPHDRGDLREELVGRIPRFLNAEDHTVAENAAATLRTASAVVHGFPDLVEVIEDLCRQVNDRRIGAAEEAARTLACFLSTRPREFHIPAWDGKPKPSSLTSPAPDPSWRQDIDQRHLKLARTIAVEASGFYHIVDKLSPQTIQLAVDTLRSNVKRPGWKSNKRWTVERTCCVAVGLLGYQRPDLVEDAAQDLLDLWTEREGPLEDILYALTCIGYSSPNLLPDWFMEELEAIISGDLTAPTGIRLAAEVGVEKVGHAPMALAERGVNGDVAQAVDRLLRFLIAGTRSFPKDVVDAFVVLLEGREENLVDALMSEVRCTADKGWKMNYYDANLMWIVRQLAEQNPSSMTPLLGLSPTIINAEGMHPNWFHHGARAIESVLEVTSDEVKGNLRTALAHRLEGDQAGGGRRSFATVLESLKAVD